MKSKLLTLVLAFAALVAVGWAQGHVAANTDDDKAQLGVYLTSSDEDGALIQSVIPGSAADEAGLKRQDLILAVDGSTVKDTDDLIKIIDSKKPGDKISIRLLRKGSEQTLNVTLKAQDENLFAWYQGKKAGSKSSYVFAPGVRDRVFASTFGSKAYLGIFHTGLTEALGEYFGVKDGHGVLISEVVEDSPAAKAGLKAGDVIVEVNGKKVEDFSDLEKELYIKKDEDSESGDEAESISVALKIVRDKARRDITVEAELKKGDFYFRSLDKDYKSALEHYKLFSKKMKGKDFFIHTPDHEELIIMGEHLKNKDLAVTPRIHLDENRIHILEGKLKDFDHVIDIDIPHNYFMSLKIDDDENIEINFNGRKFDSIDKLKDYLESPEFKAKQKEKKEKLEKKINRIKAVVKSKSEKI